MRGTDWYSLCLWVKVVGIIIIIIIIIITMKTMKMITTVISGRSVEKQNGYSLVVGQKIPLQQRKFIFRGYSVTFSLSNRKHDTY
jgi:hypothetical protein